MMRCFVINLDRATERLAWMTRAFERLDIPFERFPAIDRKNLSDEAIRQVLDPGTRHWAASEIACFLSHIELWKHVAAGNDPYVAIFEDDVHFAPTTGGFLKDWSWIPPGVEVIKLETTFNPVRIGRQGQSVMGHRLQLLNGFHSGAAGYILSKQAAAAMVAASRIISQPVDDFLFDMGHGLACWQVNPALCIQDMFLNRKAATMPSSVEAERFVARSAGPWTSRRSLKAKVAREFRRISWKILRPEIATIPFGR